MKINKLLALGLTATLGVSVGALAACTPTTDAGKTDPVDEISLLTGWDVNEEEDSQYTVYGTTDGSLRLTYEKTGSQWQYVKHLLAYEESDLQNMKTLVIEGTFTSSTDNPVVTYKIEYKGDIAPLEANVYMSETSATYEWDLSNAQLDKALRLLIFTAGADSTGEGELKLSTLKLTKDAINPDNEFTKYNPSVEAPEHDVNTITEENLAVGNWYELGSLNDIYTITENNGVVNVVKNKCNGLTEWASVTADVKGEYLQSLKSFRITVNGGKGLKLKVEAPGFLKAKEIILPDSDDNTEIICDIENPETLSADTVYTIKLYFTWDNYVKGASYNIVSAGFSTEAAPIEHVLNTITAENTSVTGWYQNSNVYTITEEENGTKIVKNVHEDWLGVYVDVTGEALKDMESFQIVVDGDIKTFKVECNDLFVATELPRDQAPVNGENTITVTLNDLSELDCSRTYSILLLFNWDNYAEGINYTITSAGFIAKTAE